MPLLRLSHLLNSLNVYLLRNSLNPDQARRFDGPGRFVGPVSGSKMFANVINTQTTLVGKELKTATVHLISYCLCFHEFCEF